MIRIPHNTTTIRRAAGRRRFMALILSVTLLAGSTLQAGVLFAPQATATALAGLPACLKWRPIGICVWLSCSLTGCKIRTSLKVRNYVPDAFVAITTMDIALQDAAGHIEKRKPNKQTRDHQIFRAGDLYGHPLSASGFLDIVDTLPGISGLVCLPRSVPLMPYFESALDYLVWRAIVPVESLYPASFIPGLREIGTFPLNTWGNVYPRTGRVLQQSEPKAAAVLAQRVGDITTRKFQPHVYIPLDSAKLPSFGVKYWGPGPLVEHQASTGTWQMIHPRPDPYCYAFGNNDSFSPIGWSDFRRSDTGNYAFNLWRPYKCCKRKGIYLFTISLPAP